MEKIIFVLIFTISVIFISYQQANAITISAVPESPSFGPNDWITVNVKVQGYNGGPISWIAHRPDNSMISGNLTQVKGDGSAIHQIVRDASDNYFGSWSIRYTYDGINQTANFKVNSLGLTVSTDKDLYYEPDMMHINITTSYYVPVAAQAKFFHLNFYDQKGNVVNDIPQIDIRASQRSIIYDFHMIGLADYHPAGLYKLRVQYFNTVVDVPFLLGRYQDLMQISAQTDKSAYKIGEAVNMDLVFTRVTQPNATLKITDPSGKTTTSQFRLFSVHTSLILNDITKSTGTWNYEIQYAGVSNSGSFDVIPNPKPLPNIKVNMFLDKLNYKLGETIHVKVSVSQAIANSISLWVTDPNGTEHPRSSFTTTAVDTILQHKISRDVPIGKWELNIDYDGIIKSAPYFVIWPPINYTEVLNANQFKIPVFVSNFATNFTSPTGIALDSNGDVYVVDSGDSKIDKFDSNGKLLLSWGSHGTGNGQFIHPNGIAVGNKYVYVADTANARIQMFYKNGTFIYTYGEYGEGQGQFHSPIALALDKKGDVFVGDSGRDRIQIFDPHLVYLSEIRSPITASGSFSAIDGMTFNAQGNFYVSAIENRILQFSNTYSFVNFYGSAGSEEGRFNNPTDIAVDSKGDFYVADTNNHRIQKFDPYGNFLLSWGSQENSVVHFEEPVGLAIDSSDNIYVVDKGTKDVQKFVLYSPNAEMYMPPTPENTTVSTPPSPPVNATSTPPENTTVSTPPSPPPSPPVNATSTPPENNTVSTPPIQPPHAEDSNIDSNEKSLVLSIIKQWKQANLHK